MARSTEMDGKSVLITGGTGSFGRALAHKLITQHKPKKVIIFSRDEWKQWEMRRSHPAFAHEAMRYFLGDVRDADRLHRACYGVDYIVHAAALKQVPTAEYNPSEFVKTNIIGAMNIIDAAIDQGVEKVIALSTDKAVNPVNLYGATKLCSDKIFVSGHVYVGDRGVPKFGVVRYGNVLGSRGSIVPMWKQMVQEGKERIPITDLRMTRFWITLEQTVDFVVDSFERLTGGETFVPKIPSMKIVDLAEAICPGIEHEVCGIREGEKLHELLIGAEDARRTVEFSNHYTILPEVWRIDHPKPMDFFLKNNGKRLPDGFVYASNTNARWIGVEELRELLNGKTPPKSQPGTPATTC